MSGTDQSKAAGSPNTSQHQSLSHQQLSAVSSLSLQQFNNVLAPSNSVTSMLDHYRLSQLYQYALAADRLRCPLPTSTATSAGTGPAGAFHHNAMSVFRPEMAAAAVAAVPLLYNNPYYRLDPRLALYRPPEEPKPQHSYIGLIAMAILSSVDKKLVLSDIYQYILDNYAYFRSRGPGWRNSIRHNLSLNDCFVKAGRSANGKGHYWAIHPANIDDFTKGDFRRRKAQRKVRRHMGLAVDDEDSPSPPPSSPPLSILRPTPDILGWQEHHPNFMRQSITQHLGFGNIGLGHLAHQPMPDIPPFANNIPVGFNKYISSNSNISDFPLARSVSDQMPRNAAVTTFPAIKALGRKGKRQFDVASLLAPEMKEALQQVSPSSGNGEHAGYESNDNDNGSNSPLEKMYESKLGSSSSSLFQAQSDDGGDDDQHDEDRQKVNTREKLNASAGSPSKSPSPKLLNVTTDKDDLLTPNQSDGKTSRGGIVHARRLAQRRHFHSRRVTGIAGDSFNNNKEQSTTNCNSRRLISLNENHSAESNVRDFGNEYPYAAAAPGLSTNRSHPNANELFFQQNPSLASLVILSSRYRELTSSLQQQFNTNANRRDQK